MHKLYIPVLVLLLVFSSCAERRTIQIDGSSTVYRITEAVVEEFLRENRDIHPDVGISGTGGGFQKFCEGTVDVANASRPITVQEIEKCDEAGIEFIELPVAYDGLTLVVHPDNDFVNELTIDELKRVFSTKDTAQKWSDLREGLPNEQIKVASPGEDSGTFDYFADTVFGEEAQLRPDALVSEDDNTIVRAVAGDAYSIGFFGFAYYEESKEKLKLVSVVNPKTGKAVEPGEQTVKNGEYSPLSRPLFIYIKKSSLSNPDVIRFIDFYLENAELLSRDVGYIPIPKSAFEKVRLHYKSKIVGSKFSEIDDLSGKTIEEIY